MLIKVTFPGSGSDLPLLVTAGIPTYVDSAHRIHHNKVMVFDKRRFATGSFNFSASAQNSNAENNLICTGPEIAAKYLENYELHKAHSVLQK